MNAIEIISQQGGWMRPWTLVTGLAALTLAVCPALPWQVTEAQSADVDFDIALDHVALSVPDLDASIAWYAKMFGFKVLRRSGQADAAMQTATIERGNVNIELFQLRGAASLPESRRNPSEDFRTHGVKHFAFYVKDVRAVVAELKAKGVQIAFDIRENPGAVFAFVSDNAGNAVELIQRKAQ
jgi:catechol 2,3-dioxygenase-like lactoylglutathione lyase family enzyme